MGRKRIYTDQERKAKRKELDRRRYLRDKEKILARTAAWQRANPDKCHEYRTSHESKPEIVYIKKLTRVWGVDRKTAREMWLRDLMRARERDMETSDR